jgi:hypothetical protein
VLGSRLPKFADPDARKSPSGYKAKVDFYSSPNSVRFRLWDSGGKQTVDKTGQFWWHPKGVQPGQGKDQVYPNHIVVSVDGIVDILEQRAPEPVLYLTDDKTLWETIGEQPKDAKSPVAPQ